jgi:hypothetical protein
MQVKPPRVPRGAQVAFAGLRGPRVVPGRYTLRLTKGSEKVEGALVIAVDRRAPYGPKDRAAQFQAVIAAGELFGEMSTLVDRIEGAHVASVARAAVMGASDELRPRLDNVAGKLEELRKKIVATKEGGAVTGEERLREHLDEVYQRLSDWEGRPAGYLVERVDVLRRELREVQDAFESLAHGELREVSDQLRKRSLQPIPTDATTALEPLPLPPGELPSLPTW